MIANRRVRRGVTAVEYAVMLALFICVVIVAVTAARDQKCPHCGKMKNDPVMKGRAAPAATEAAK